MIGIPLDCTMVEVVLTRGVPVDPFMEYSIVVVVVVMPTISTPVPARYAAAIMAGIRKNERAIEFARVSGISFIAVAIRNIMPTSSTTNGGIISIMLASGNTIK